MPPNFLYDAPISNFDRIPSDQVTIKKDRLRSINNNYKAMLYFCSRILDMSEDKISITDLENFEMIRFHRTQQFIKNYSWPVSLYFERIKELESEIAKINEALQNVQTIRKKPKT